MNSGVSNSHIVAPGAIDACPLKNVSEKGRGGGGLNYLVSVWLNEGIR